MKPRSQIVATAAFERINPRKTSNSIEENKKYATLVHKLPAMILQNGLAQTTGFLLSKPKEPHFQALLGDLQAVFVVINHPLDINKSLHENIIESDLHKIMRMTREALEIAGWLRRYVQGILKIGPDGNSLEENEKDKEEQS
ncbi:CRISPR system Cmr subunit Cmr5 [Marinomonas spartinae]|uniref:type III-B CRISPR module-associated protein Cmr5 n=1 Tax=Marinomonas spartinae TaxID=1792290 RepID=UPI000808F289|nr:type III-B CRISPR module-associated protein Cmr5 [Marinomonas spartinae]SBS35736.1 CRISPR system Cmr subunit Cmr5 [Marinomonas spartinae]